MLFSFPTVARVRFSARFITGAMMSACLLVLPVRAASSGQAKGGMTLPEIEAALQKNPPQLSANPVRAEIAASLDQIVTIRVDNDLTAENRAKLKPLAEYYRRQVDRGLDALESTRVTNGVHIFKFYSSSIILKSAEGTIAVDFAQGPVRNDGEPEQADIRRTGFHLTPPQRDRLARLVDASFITHRHFDHADYSLSKRLASQGKPVVGPAQLKTVWKDLASAITVPDFTKPQKIGPAELVAFKGCQYSRNKVGEDGQRVAFPNEGFPHADSETIVYLLRIGGIVYLQSGENHVPADGWFRRSVALGFRPDLRGSTGQFQGGRALDAPLKELGPIMHLPRHEYEMTHPDGGNRMGSLFTGTGGKLVANGQSLVLFWGEHFPITSADLPK